jgi:hypothetical protein
VEESRGAEILAMFLGCLAFLAGDDEDPDARRVTERMQSLAEIKTGELGHHQVEKEGVWRMASAARSNPGPMPWRLTRAACVVARSPRRLPTKVMKQYGQFPSHNGHGLFLGVLASAFGSL